MKLLTLINVKNTKMKRSYDIILWGASGFTGALVAEYFLRGIWTK